MQKKIVAVVLSALLLMAFGSTAYAADKVKNTQSPVSEVKETIVTAPEALEQIAINEGITAPEGKQLVAVKTTVVKLLSEDAAPSKAVTMAAATASSLTISNVRTTGYRYYSDDYDSYWYDGPYSLSTTYGQTRYAGYSSTVSVSSSLVSAAVGFSVTSSYYKTGSYSTYVPEGQSLCLHVHMNYLVKAFDVYNGGTMVGTGSAWRPYSLIFREYWYA